MVDCHCRLYDEFVCRVHKLSVYRHVFASRERVSLERGAHDARVEHIRCRPGFEPYGSGAFERGTICPFQSGGERCTRLTTAVLRPQTRIYRIAIGLRHLDYTLRGSPEYGDVARGEVLRRLCRRRFPQRCGWHRRRPVSEAPISGSDDGLYHESFVGGRFTAE
jgi:hypothetical protein